MTAMTGQAAIADKIQGQKERLIETWIAAVREDPRIESDAGLSKPELRDHIPAIIGEICSLIRQDETPGVRNSQEARANVYVRLQQGYKGRDLVRELSLLRIILLNAITEIKADKSLKINDEASHSASTIVNQYLDEEMRYAIAVFGSAAQSSPEATIGDQQ